MALSFGSIEKAYKVFNTLELQHIVAFPSDLREADEREQDNPQEQQPYGIDRKSDFGWENLFFFIKNPTTEFIEQWDALKSSVPNSSFQKAYKRNPEYMMFGWLVLKPL